jgi:hypothetical protein
VLLCRLWMHWRSSSIVSSWGSDCRRPIYPWWDSRPLLLQWKMSDLRTGRKRLAWFWSSS